MTNHFIAWDVLHQDTCCRNLHPAFVAVSNVENHLEFPHQWCRQGRFHNSPYHRALWLLGQLLLLTWALLWDMISHMTHIWHRQTKSKLRISLSQSYAHFPHTKTRVRLYYCSILLPHFKTSYRCLLLATCQR